MNLRTGRIFKDPYSVAEIKVLVDEYEELDGLRSKAWIQVRLLDVEQAYAALPPAEKEAVLLFGFLNLPLVEVSAIMDEDQKTMWDRYARGLRYLASYLNGGS
jgi:DNA-directed RNA polymerase specialized sigma24 family protein